MRDYNEISSLVKVSTNRKLAHEIRGWLVRISKNLWVPDRCWPRICTSIASISRRRRIEVVSVYPSVDNNAAIDTLRMHLEKGKNKFKLFQFSIHDMISTI